jgi:hypothetical protein
MAIRRRESDAETYPNFNRAMSNTTFYGIAQLESWVKSAVKGDSCYFKFAHYLNVRDRQLTKIEFLKDRI